MSRASGVAPILAEGHAQDVKERRDHDHRPANDGNRASQIRNLNEDTIAKSQMKKAGT